MAYFAKLQGIKPKRWLPGGVPCKPSPVSIKIHGILPFEQLRGWKGYFSRGYFSRGFAGYKRGGKTQTKGCSTFVSLVLGDLSKDLGLGRQ